MIQEVVVNEFFEEIERAKQPGYVSRYDDFDFEYTDAPRSKPARFDGAHRHSGRAATCECAKTSANSDGVPKNHFRRDAVGRRPSCERIRRRQTGGSFGAGIFPAVTCDCRICALQFDQVRRNTFFLTMMRRKTGARRFTCASQISKSSESVPFR